MKTPHAIVIGLSLIAAAIFFKDTMTPPANALTLGGPDGFGCLDGYCYVFEGDVATGFLIQYGLEPTRDKIRINWRTGEQLD